MSFTAILGASGTIGSCLAHQLVRDGQKVLLLGRDLRNAVAVGANPDRIAILDNFCWGDPTRPETLGSLVAAVRGCHDAAVHFGTPFISGKDSLNNEYLGADGERHFTALAARG